MLRRFSGSRGETGSPPRQCRPGDGLSLRAGSAHAAAGVRHGDGGHRSLVARCSLLVARCSLLVAETTMAARLTCAKQKIAAARIPYAVPSAGELPERVDAADRHPPPVRRRAHCPFGRGPRSRRAHRPRARSGAHAGAAAAGRPRGRGTVGAAARPPRAPRDPDRRAGEAAPPRGAGPLGLRPRPDRRGRRTSGGGAERRPSRSFRVAGGDRGAACAGFELCRDRLAADPCALRRAGADLAVTRGRAEPRGGGLDGCRAGRRAGPRSRRSSRTHA